MKTNSAIVLSIVCMCASSALGMELNTPMRENIPAFDDAAIRSLREQIIIPTDKYNAVDKFYREIRNEYIQHNYPNKYETINTSLEKQPYEKLKESLDAANCDIILVWHSQYLTMRDIHLIKTSNYPYALQELSNLPGIQAYMRDYFQEYRSLRIAIASTSQCFFLCID